MQNLLSLLPYLLCPVGMGLMMWFMMRDNKGETTNASGHTHQKSDVEGVTSRASSEAHTTETSPSWAASVLKFGSMCLNPRVIAGLAVVGVGIWVLAPGLVWTALPLLFVAACPLSMLFMMRGMGSTGSMGGMDTSVARSNQRPTPLDRTAEVVNPDIGREVTVASDERLAELKTQLSDIEVQRESVANEIARVEGAGAKRVRGARVAVEPAESLTRA